MSASSFRPVQTSSKFIWNTCLDAPFSWESEATRDSNHTRSMSCCWCDEHFGFERRSVDMTCATHVL